MNGIIPPIKFSSFVVLIIVVALTSGCSSSKKYSGFTFVRKYQKNIPFVFKNNISLTANDVSSDERVLINFCCKSLWCQSARSSFECDRL